MRQVAAIVAAAGMSRRMGCCKQLLEIGGRSALARCLLSLLDGGIQDVVVVVGLHGEAVAAEAGRFPVRIIVNDDPDGDMASSVRAGHAAISRETGGVIVALGDYPLVRPGTICCMRDCHASAPEQIIVPSHGGRRGHPLLLPRHILDELQDGLTLRDVIRRVPDRVKHVEVYDPGILEDMDTPEDYQRLCALV